METFTADSTDRDLEIWQAIAERLTFEGDATDMLVQVAEVMHQRLELLWGVIAVQDGDHLIARANWGFGATPLGTALQVNFNEEKAIFCPCIFANQCLGAIAVERPEGDPERITRIVRLIASHLAVMLVAITKGPGKE